MVGKGIVEEDVAAQNNAGNDSDDERSKSLSDRAKSTRSRKSRRKLV